MSSTLILGSGAAQRDVTKREALMLGVSLVGSHLHSGAIDGREIKPQPLDVEARRRGAAPLDELLVE